MEITINQSLSLQKILRERKAELENLRAQVSTKESRRFFMSSADNNQEVTKEPQYDVKFVDKKIVDLANALFLIDSAVKQANATTKLNLAINTDDLLAPLQ